jgi:hypothetical protein
MTKGNIARALAEAVRVAGAGELTEDEARVILQILFTRAGTDPCFVKAAEDEPLFILRAQDRIAPKTVRAWAEFARALGADAAKTSEAMDCAIRMEKWQRETGRMKCPD